MAAAAGLTLGRKDATLSSASLYALYEDSRSPVVIDPSALQRLCSCAPSARGTKIPDPLAFIFNQIDPVTRPAAAVLLNKLLLTAADSSALVTARLANCLSTSYINSCSLVTFDEAAVATASVPLVLALAAVIDFSATPLSRVADAVVALSCEAARLDATAALHEPASKDEVDVASDIKKLLIGSNLLGRAGGTSSSSFGKVPTVHGIFRQTVRALHEKVQIELNTPVKLWKRKRDAGVTGEGKEEALMLLAAETGKLEEEALIQLALNISRSLHSVCKLSMARTRLCAMRIADAEVREKLANYVTVCQLNEMFDRIQIDVPDTLCILGGVRNYMFFSRRVLACEAAVAMAVIEMDSSIEKPQARGEKAEGDINSKKKIINSKKKITLRPGHDSTNGKHVIKLPLPQAAGEKVKGDEKSEKKKTLGKGTSCVLMLFRDHANERNDVLCVNSKLASAWRVKLEALFDPACDKLESFWGQVKEAIAIESSEVRRLPKIPKGTRDFGGEQMAIRQRAFSIITGVFRMHGGVALDTPVFELRETLMGKYGEDCKLIYDLADQGGELCSLRYDLTVPFARYLAMNNLSALKRYQIGKVYRRDKPSKGRYREFYQCDFDIAGVYEPMEADFEVIKILTELLDKLDIGMYEIKVNHRKLLDGMLEICGVPPEKFRTVCSSIDKLDKLTLEEVKKELVEEKGVPNETAEKIGNLVKTRGPPLEVVLELRKEGSKFMEHDGSVVALSELEILFRALEKANAINMISFDLSLARGLDYYTGVIFEAVFKGAIQVGSIAAGGRYDNLVGSISVGKHVPAVGVSLGIERVFAIMEQQVKEKSQVIRETETEVLLSILGKDLILAAELVNELWSAGINAEFKLTTRVLNHIRYATRSGIPWMVLVGKSEMMDGKVKLKDIRASREEDIPRKDFVQVLKQRLGKP